MADGSKPLLSNIQDQKGTDARSISVVSFFCGCGGLDLGFRGGFEFLGRPYGRTHFETHAAYDIDKASIATYRLNLGSAAQVADLAAIAPEQLPHSDVLIGGFPCQEFSNCGPRKGLSSDRGSLYLSMVRYAAFHKPLVVVAENVAGLLTLNGGADLQKIKDDFATAGYRSNVWEMRAERYGVPQARHRIFLLFIRNDLNGDPTPPEREGSHIPVSVKSAIEDLLRPNGRRIANQGQYFKAVKAGNGHGQGDERSPKNGPGYTVRANSRSRVQFHYCRPRRLTVRECARLQTFPDNFEFPFSATTNMKQIGNAVPPVLAHKVAMQIQAFIHAEF